MKCANFLTILTFLLTSYSSFSQEYGYTHYDIGDGLAGSTVYCIAQDRDGFIWAATETGVSRFDGTHFRNFTLLDGLPDLEMLQLFGDKEGRLWMAPFKNSVCYWYQGRIHNQENDSILGRIRLRQNIENFAEDRDGNILIQESSAFQVIKPDGTIREYDSLDGRAVFLSAAVCVDSSGHFRVQVANRVYEETGRGFQLKTQIEIPDFLPNYFAMSPSWLVWRKSPVQCRILSFATGKIFTRPFGKDVHLSYGILDDSLLYTSDMLGCMEQDLRSGRSRRFLPGKPVSRVFQDVDGNLWFSTMGEGIYRLNSDWFSTVFVPGPDSRSGIESILLLHKELLVGTDRNHIYGLSIPGLKVLHNFGDRPTAKNRILFIDSLNESKLICGCDNSMNELTGPNYKETREDFACVKSLMKCADGSLLAATTWGVGNFDVRRWRFDDTIWRERATVAYRYGDTVFIGTLNGLYRLESKSNVQFLGARNLLFRSRVLAIVRSANGIYWIASNGAGVIGLQGDSVVSVVNKAAGLTSDICRTIRLDGDRLWVGTDRGLNRIELGKPGHPITRYTSNDGLSSNIVNTIFVDSPLVYVGTPAGLSYFDPDKMGLKEGCRLFLLSVINGRRDQIEDTANLVIPYADRSVRFEYAGVSYRSGSDITYRYRMIGLDSIWRTTKQTVLEYPVLPPGSYEFQLSAMNKFGVNSDLLSQRFSVITPFWLTTWFDALVVAMFAAGTWALTSWRIRTIRRRQREKGQLTRKMMELERMALQAQMNPHFIFNCLTSVQQYIVDQDIPSANKYITGLAKLIRLTLNNSSLAFIRLKDEVKYLSAYMALEKLRFKEKMEYSIDVDPQIIQTSCYIPPMLIQPYVENSVRHGLRHRKGGMGYIRLSVCQNQEAERPRLTIIVEDNGIGRERSAQYQTAQHIEYQSKGMTMTAERIRMINAAYGGDIRVEVIDLEDAAGQPAGTRVVMQFSRFDNLHLNQKEML